MNDVRRAELLGLFCALQILPVLNNTVVKAYISKISIMLLQEN